VWHGGIWDWLDPITALRGLAFLRERDARWRLLFTGAGRPSHRPGMSMSERARQVARDLGLEQAGAVHFATWTPYDKRAQPLLEADVGVSLHLPTLESRFAFRTRMLDYVWARLPIVASAGDEWADRIEREGLGEVVAPGDPAAFAEAVGVVAGKGREAYDQAFSSVARALRWSEVARPLLALVAGAPSTPRSIIAPALALRHSAAALADDLRGLLRPS
jgi:glycosyltransferase involved in cell wall biosynthesis